MRKRFEQQLAIGQTPIEEILIPIKSKNALDELLVALKEVYINNEYNERIFNILEDDVYKSKEKTGRKGMNLWCIFVPSTGYFSVNTTGTFSVNIYTLQHYTPDDLIALFPNALILGNYLFFAHVLLYICEQFCN